MSTNFLSPDFDPLKALETAGLEPPVKSVRPKDNIALCRHFLPEDDPNYKPLKSSTIPERKEKGNTGSKKGGESKLRGISKFSSDFKAPRSLYRDRDGPLMVLQLLFTKKCRVKVWIRRDRGIRGTLIGYLRAFDKHCNLVLIDVDEDFKQIRYKERIRTTPAGGAEAKMKTKKVREEETSVESGEPKEPTKWKKRILVKQQRHMNQLFIRGDNVVLICEYLPKTGS